ncbi:phosphatase PAP2 family protein [Candidatus Phytoplasma fraxini]|uniref:Phosphatase PAP2 family protein n=1 Tax=Ash yellows phytoplasma TaxID=35780 RepID=A0ABZ2U7L9_ASHYP
MSNEHNCTKKLLSKNSDNYKRLKNYILKFFFMILVSLVMYYAVLFCLYYNNNKQYYVSEDGDSAENNYWINILNLGLNERLKNNNLSFPVFSFSSCFVFIYIGSFFWWYLITPILAYKYLYSENGSDPKILHCLFKSFFIFLFIASMIFCIFPIQCLEIKDFKDITSKDHNSICKFLIVKSNLLLKQIYDLDCTRLNCLPSFHVSNSWFCYIPFRIKQNKKIPKKVIYFQFIIAVLVFISTFVIKQHYIMDGICSIVLVELIFSLVWLKIKNKK